MVGSMVLQLMKNKGYSNLLTRSRDELDLRNQQAIDNFMRQHKPDVVVLAAARVGGILANDRNPYPFLYENLMIESNVINAAHQCNVDQLVFLGSSCIYPKQAEQPIKEEYLLSGPLEPTNQWYAIAKIAGIKLCEALNKQHNRNYVSLMPTNLYGPRDNFDLITSHVVPAMIRKFYEAKVHGNKAVGLWGTGDPKREFLHVRDMADAIMFSVEQRIEGGVYNVGTGQDISIRELAYLIQKIVGHRGEIIWDTTKPDGTPRKLLDVSKIHAVGWEHECELEEGLRDTYGWYLENIDDLKEVKI